MEYQKTQLYNQHCQLGAKMVPFAGFEMPIQYTSLKEESLAVRNQVGVFDVSHMGEFFLEGPESEKLADYLVTNDIAGALPQKAVYSPLCRENGTMIDDLIVYKLGKEEILLCVNASNIQKDWDHIQNLSRDFQCSLSNRSQDFSLLALQGPKAHETLIRLRILPKDLNLPYYSVAKIPWEKEHLIVARTGYTGEDGFEIFCSHPAVKTLWDLFLQENVTPCGLGARDVLRLEVGFPLYGNDLTDDLTPLDCGLKWTVKFTKPQFFGKAALEKHIPKFQLVKLSLDKGIPRKGYPVENLQGETIGTVSSGTLSPKLERGIALAHVEVSKMPPDKQFFINIREKKFPATYHPKAFLTGGHL